MSTNNINMNFDLQTDPFNNEIFDDYFDGLILNSDVIKSNQQHQQKQVENEENTLKTTSNTINEVQNKPVTKSSPEKNKKKRKLKTKSENDQKPKKPRKATYQRKNIKKIITENDLQKSTLQALQEEEERKQRLQEYQFTNHQTNLTVENEYMFPIVNDEVVIDNNEVIEANEIETSVREEDEKLESTDDCLNNVKVEEARQISTDNDDIIVLDNSIGELKVNSYYKNNQNNGHYEDDTINPSTNETEDDENDDDDCQIISDTEEVVTKPKPGLHVNDDLNIPDSNGQVLVNVNHPPDEQNIYLADHLASRIKPHQIGGIRFLYDNIIESLSRVKNKNNGFGCILAHSMGLGKTFQIVTFTDIFLRSKCCKRVLCIVPINTIQNWLSEFNYWLPENNKNIKYKREFNVSLLNDNFKTFSQRSKIILKWRDEGGVLLIGYEMFRTFITLKACKQRKTTSKQNKRDVNFIDLEEESKNNSIQEDIREALLTPCLVVCDEGHRIKNSSTNISKTLKCIKTKRRIVLTGYPLQNNLIEYWCMVDFVRPSYLGTKPEFCNMFERPIMNGQCVDSTYDDIRTMRYRSHVLHSLLGGFVQRRGHDVFLKTLPPKEEYVILLKLTKIQKELYLAFMDSIGAMIVGEKQNPLRAFAICCKIWNHPDVLYDCVMSNKDADNDLDLPELQGSTKHSVAKPTTSQEFFLNEGDAASNEFAAYSSERSSKSIDLKWALKVFDSNYRTNVLENGAKMMVAFSIIEGAIMNGEKILLFSQSLLTLNLIEQFLSKSNVPNSQEKWEKYKNYYRIDGSTNGLERERMINSFNEKNNGFWLFLLSTRAGCLGINLIGANRVIIFDASFNPCHDAQAVCRVYRYGQQKKSYIYRLIADHTMEKKIYDRQINKQNVSDRVVDEIQSENHFTRTEVEKLIHYVKEDALPADLRDIHKKYNDQVLIASCLKYRDLITKEPFKHESLLLDKKEYQLSEREKRDAIRHYDIEKKMPLNCAKNSYAASYFARLNASNSIHRSPSSTLTLSSHYSSLNNIPINNYRQPMALTHSVSYAGISNTLPNNLMPSGYTNGPRTANSYDDIQIHDTSYSSDSSDIQIIDNSNNQNSQNSNNIESSSSSDINNKNYAVHRFITTTAITIPSSNTSTYSTAKIIPAGQSVILLKTSKGCYLRTSDGKLYAIRNTSQPPTTSADATAMVTYENNNYNHSNSSFNNYSQTQNSLNYDYSNSANNSNNTVDLNGYSQYQLNDHDDNNQMYSTIYTSNSTIPSTTPIASNTFNGNNNTSTFNSATNPIAYSNEASNTLIFSNNTINNNNSLSSTTFQNQYQDQMQSQAINDNMTTNTVSDYENFLFSDFDIVP